MLYTLWHDMSHVTYDLSLGTYDLSLVTYELSLMMCDLSPVVPPTQHGAAQDEWYWQGRDVPVQEPTGDLLQQNHRWQTHQ